MTTVLNGLLGGLAAGLAAGAVARLVGGDSSVAGAVVGRALGERAGSARWVRLAGVVLYGGAAGAGLLVLELYALGLLGVPPTVGEAVGLAVVWGAALFGVWALVWRGRGVAGVRELLVYHLAFGVGLGLWIRLTWIT